MSEQPPQPLSEPEALIPERLTPQEVHATRTGDAIVDPSLNMGVFGPDPEVVSEPKQPNSATAMPIKRIVIDADNGNGNGSAPVGEPPSDAAKGGDEWVRFASGNAAEVKGVQNGQAKNGSTNADSGTSQPENPGEKTGQTKEQYDAMNAANSLAVQINDIIRELHVTDTISPTVYTQAQAKIAAKLEQMKEVDPDGAARWQRQFNRHVAPGLAKLGQRVVETEPATTEPEPAPAPTPRQDDRQRPKSSRPPKKTSGANPLKQHAAPKPAAPAPSPANPATAPMPAAAPNPVADPNAASAPKLSPEQKAKKLGDEVNNGIMDLEDALKAGTLTVDDFAAARVQILRKFKQAKKLNPEYDEENLDKITTDLERVATNAKFSRVSLAMARARLALGRSPKTKTGEGTAADPDAKKRGKVWEALGNAGWKMRTLGTVAVASTLGGIKKGNKLVGDYYADTEKGKRRKIVTGVVAAAALVGAGVAIYFGISDGSEAKTSGAGAGVDPNALGDTSTGVGVKGVHPELVHAPAAPVTEHVRVKSGDSVWKILNEHNGHNNHTTGNMIADHKVSITDKHGHVRTSDLGHIRPGDTVNFEMPQSGGTGQAAHEATQHAAAANTGAHAGPNTEVLEHYNSHTGAGTLSGATLDHVHHMGLELPTKPGALAELTKKVADFNHIKPAELTHLQVGQQIDFPPQVQFEEWVRHLDELDKQAGRVKAV